VSPEELIRATYDAVNRGDLAALLALMDPEVRVRSLAIRSARGDWFEGRAGVRDWWEAMVATYDAFAFELVDLQVEGDRAVAELRAWFVLDGRDLQAAGWQSARVRNGRIVCWARYDTEEEARRSVDLPARR